MQLIAAILILGSSVYPQSAGVTPADQPPPSSVRKTGPRVIKTVPPEYTAGAWRKNIQGVVVLEVEIDDKGSVQATRVIKSLDPGLDKNAMKAVKKWKFSPATRDGQPVPLTFTLEVRFEKA